MYLSKTSSTWLLSFVAIFTVILYLPGLPGEFILDDSANLSPLQRVALNDWISVKEFITENNSGPLGRPVSMFSFLLNYSHWPENPSYFKIINIALHAISGIAIFFMLRILMKHFKFDHRKSSLIAITVTCLWLVHPLHVSTVLYSVQRMTILAGLFSILTILFFLRLINYLSNEHENNIKANAPTILRYLVIYNIFLMLAILSKESALAVFFLLSYLSLILISKPNIKVISYLMVLIILPTVCVITAIIYYGFYFESSLKPYTTTERLLSQTHILLIYLRQILIPDISSMGVFNTSNYIDNSYLKFGPYTIISMVVTAGLLTSLFLLKDRVIKFGIAWYFLSHIIESTVIPLDLYYEHRNYVASIGPILIVVYLINCFAGKYTNKMGLGIFLVLSTQTAILASIWSSNNQLLGHYNLSNPSPVVGIVTLEKMLRESTPQHALSYVNNFLKNEPKFPDLYVAKYFLECMINKINDDVSIQKAMHQIENQKITISNNSVTFDYLAYHVNEGYCKTNDPDLLRNMILRLIEVSPQSNSDLWLSKRYYNIAQIYQRQLPVEYYMYLQKSFNSYRHAKYLAELIIYAHENGDYDELNQWISESDDLVQMHTHESEILEHVIMAVQAQRN